MNKEIYPLDKIYMKKNFQHLFHLEISFNDTNFKNWCTSSRVPAGYKDLCAFFIQNDQLQTAFALWIEYLYFLWLIIILLGDKHTTLHRECVSMGAAGARTRRSLGHHLLHSLILRLLVLCAPAVLRPRAL